MRIRRFLPGAALALTAGPSFVGAQLGVQRERNAPSVYAITNVESLPSPDRRSTAALSSCATA
jgi:hypothetical protein